MPTAPPKACPCGGTVRNGKCDRCGPRKQHRLTTGQRGYDYAWQQFREQRLAEDPLCKDCEAEGIVTPATELHHIRKIKDAPHLRLDADNVLPLCGRCHDRRTARGE